MKYLIVLLVLFSGCCGSSIVKAKEVKEVCGWDIDHFVKYDFEANRYLSIPKSLVVSTTVGFVTAELVSFKSDQLSFEDSIAIKLSLYKKVPFSNGTSFANELFHTCIVFLEVDGKPAVLEPLNKGFGIEVRIFSSDQTGQDNKILMLTSFKKICRFK
jgi:hypothetical protein